MVLVIALQFLYPVGKLLPFTSVEGISLSGWSKTDAVDTLNGKYQQQDLAINFEDSTEAYKISKPAELGIGIDNTRRIEDLNYPWYLRAIPTSLLWGTFVSNSGQVSYSHAEKALDDYIKTNFGSSDCRVTPQNASIKVQDSKLVVVDGAIGGTCNLNDVRTALLNFNPSPGSGLINLPIKVELPAVTSNDAQNLADKLNQSLVSDINIVVIGKSISISHDKLMSWLDFKVTSGKLDYSFNTKRATSYLNELLSQKVKVEASVTTVKTNDFVEVSRVNGTDGQKLDVSETLGNIKDYINGKSSIVSVGLAKAKSPIKYIRSYTNTYTGMVALMQNFADFHSGSYGITLVELSGKYRTAAYSGDKQFVTASTYKLFVAYSTLLRVENGSWKWSDKIEGDRDLTKCFDDMIVVSDNDCAKALELKIGFRELTNEAHAVGATSTSFMGTNIVSTSNDISRLLSLLATGKILNKQSDRDIWINAMKRNIYRQGIPSGVSYTVADKAGFLWELLHDAAIVYSPNGTYVLVVMTDGSSWGNIAGLTKELDALISK